MADRSCRTCKHFEPSPIRRKGWCRNPLLYSPQQSHLVHQDELDCGHGLGNYWEPADSLDRSEPAPAGAEDTPEAAPLRLMMTEPHLVPAAAGVVARSSSGGSGGNPFGSGGSSAGSGRTPGGSGGGAPPPSGRPGGSGRGGPPGPERSVSYQPEERYWTDYLRIALPAVGLILMLGLFWYWATALIDDDDDNGGGTTIAGTTATATSPSGIAGQPTVTPTPSLPEEPTETPAERPTRTPRSAGEETPTTEGDEGDFAEGDNVRTTVAVNLRSEPAQDDANVITVLDAGTVLTVTGETVTGDGIDWVPVITEDGEEGFVAKGDGEDLFLERV
jgi:hypothetical protein